MTGIEDKLGFGCVALSAMPSIASALGILNECYDKGIRHFDTAPIYGSGYSELILKQFIKKYRSTITITTKFGLNEPGLPRIPAVVALPLNYIRKKIKSQPQEVKDNLTENIPEVYKRTIDTAYLKNSLENSLQRLGAGYIDYYLFHEGLPQFITEDAFEYLLTMKDKGVVKKIGIATNAAHICELENDSLAKWDVLQYDVAHVEYTHKLLSQYPDKEHIHHSCLRVKHIDSTNIPEKEKPGFILATCADANKNGKVLFSTTSKTHLENNILSYKKFRKCITDAVYRP